MAELAVNVMSSGGGERFDQPGLSKVEENRHDGRMVLIVHVWTKLFALEFGDVDVQDDGSIQICWICANTVISRFFFHFSGGEWHRTLLYDITCFVYLSKLCISYQPAIVANLLV